MDVINLDPENFQYKQVTVPLEDCSLIYQSTDTAMRTRSRIYEGFESCFVLGPNARGSIYRGGTGQTNEFVYVTDLSATLLEVAEAEHPGTSYKGRTVFPMNAKSALSLMRGETSTHRGADEWLGYELFGNSAMFHGDYKALRLGAWLASAGVAGLHKRFRARELGGAWIFKPELAGGLIE